MISVEEYNKNMAICGLTTKIIKESKGSLDDKEMKELVENILENIVLPFNFKTEVVTDCNVFRDILMLKRFSYDFDGYYDFLESKDFESWNEHDFLECKVEIATEHCFDEGSQDVYIGYHCNFDQDKKYAIVLKADYFGNDYEETEYLLYIYNPSNEQEWKYTPAQKQILEMLGL